MASDTDPPTAAEEAQWWEELQQQIGRHPDRSLKDATRVAVGELIVDCQARIDELSAHRSFMSKLGADASPSGRRLDAIKRQMRWLGEWFKRQE